MFDDLAFHTSREGEGLPALKLYALTSCDHCKEGMKFLDSLGMRYAYIYVDDLRPEDRIRIKKDVTRKYQRNLLFPLLELPGDVFLFGFEEDVWRRSLEDLDRDL